MEYTTNLSLDWKIIDEAIHRVKSQFPNIIRWWNQYHNRLETLSRKALPIVFSYRQEVEVQPVKFTSQQLKTANITK